jgi:hypothetical protein
LRYQFFVFKIAKKLHRINLLLHIFMAAAADHAVAATPEPRQYPMALDELLHRTTFEDRRQCRQAVWACAVDNVRYSLDDERAARLWLQQNGYHAQVNCSCY